MEAPGDLGVEKPNQVILKNFPARVFSGKKRSFNSSWYSKRDWLEYSINADAAFCYPCRKFRAPSSATDTTFTIIRFCDWKHSVETGKGDHDAFDCMSEDGCRLFLSLFEYTLRKDAVLAKIAQTIPHNAR